MEIFFSPIISFTEISVSLAYIVNVRLGSKDDKSGWSRLGKALLYIAIINTQDISHKSLHRSTPSIVCTALIKWTVNSYWLGSRTTAILFDPRTDLLPEAAGWGQHIPATDPFEGQTKLLLSENPVCNYFLYTFIFQKILIHS